MENEEVIVENEEKLDFEDFREGLGSFAEKFRPFIESKEMWDIMQKIKEDAQTEVIVPFCDNTFRAFKTTDIKNLKVIFFLQDPYPRFYGGKHRYKRIPQATGIAMDCSNSPDKKLQPSLDQWYNGMEDDLGQKVNRVADLTYLHSQGVMMLNNDLTCKLNKTSSHEGLWLPFMKYLVSDILGSDAGIIYVLCGKTALSVERYINPFCRIFKLSHPNSAEHNHTTWYADGVFKKINNILKNNKQEEIFWNYDLYKAIEELPF